MCAQNGYFIKLDNGYFKILTYLWGNVSGNTLKQRLVSWSNHSTYRWTCVFESVVSIETIVLQVPWQWYSNWKRIFAYILESNKECKQRKACLDFFVLVFDRKHVLFAFNTLQILILFSTHAFSTESSRFLFPSTKYGNHIFMSPIFPTKKDMKGVVVKENVVPGICAINKDSGYPF